MKEFYLDSCGGGRLHCAIWTPEGEPKAVVSSSTALPSISDGMTNSRVF